MGGALFRWFIRRLVRLYYSRIVEANDGLRRAPPQTIFVLNHPNAALDPAVILAVLGRTIVFLSKSTPFAHPASRWVLNRFGALPVYRPVDIGKRGGARSREEMTALNEQLFDTCIKKLERGHPVALFPEGTSHSESRMMPMRTGAARLGLMAAEALGWSAVQIVPVGLWYENKTRFRSSVLIVPGKPLVLEGYAAPFRDDPRATAEKVTEVIDERLRSVVLEAATNELRQRMPAVAALAYPELDLAARQAKARHLARAYDVMHTQDPDRLARLERQVRDYDATLRALGISNPHRLEGVQPAWPGLLLWILMLSAWAPMALAGMLMSYLPYRLSAYIVRHRFADNRQNAGVNKLIVGTILVAATWIVEAVVLGLLAGVLWGLVLLAMAPLCGYLALRWSEVSRKAFGVAHAAWIRRRQGGLAAWLTAERQRLAKEIRGAAANLGVAP